MKLGLKAAAIVLRATLVAAGLGTLSAAGVAAAMPVLSRVRDHVDAGSPTGAHPGELAGELAGELTGMPFDVALSALCVLALACCWAWAVLVVGATLVEAVGIAADLARTGGVPEPPGGSRPLRAAVLALCGVALGAVVAGPAQAAPDGLGGLAVPDRPVGAAPADAPKAPASSGQAVTVHPGDSLWTLTRRLLPPDSADRAVAAAWPRLYRLNAREVGPDPDLIHPGSRLRVPAQLTPLDDPGKASR